MVKIFSAVAAVLGAGFVLGASASGAGAAYHRRGCCGPIPPSYVYDTVHRYKHVTRYRDVSVYHHTTRVHPIVHVTRIQPIVNVTTVTRYHHHMIEHVRPSHHYVSEMLPPRVYVTHASTSTYDCHCTGRYHGCR